MTRPVRLSLAALMALTSAGCLDLRPPDGVIVCASDRDCPDDWACQRDRCYRTGGLDATVNRDEDAALPQGVPDAEALPDAGRRPVDAAVDAGSDGGTDGGTTGPGPLPVCRTCNLATNASCDAGETCFMDWTRACTVCQERTGTGTAGAACVTGADCAEGFDCLRNRCRAQCPTGIACPSGTYCFDMGAPSSVPMCLDECLPGGANCPAADNCTVVSSWTGTRGTLCERAGTVPLHEACDNAERRCETGLYCARYSTYSVCLKSCGSGIICGPMWDVCLTYGSTAPTGASVGGCFEWCDEASDCGEGFTCAPYNDTGLCVPRCYDDTMCPVEQTCSAAGDCV